MPDSHAGPDADVTEAYQPPPRPVALALAARLDPLALLGRLGLRASTRFLGLGPEGLLLGELAIRSRPATLLPPRGEPLERGLMVLRS